MAALDDVREVAPSLASLGTIRVVGSDEALDDVDAVSVPVASSGEVPPALGIGREALARAGFRPTVGSCLPFPSADAPTLVAVGIGELDALTPADVRDAAAAFASAVPYDANLATRVPSSAALDAAESAAAIVEGVLLARYRFSLRSVETGAVPVSSLTLIASDGEQSAVEEGSRRGGSLARAGMLSRDLATCPAGILTASAMADLAVALGSETGLDVTVFDKDDLLEMGCGGLLGVNKGSVEPPRMIRLRYTPESDARGHLALVGKGIMYDSGGINLKPGDVSHSQMRTTCPARGRSSRR